MTSATMDEVNVAEDFNEQVSADLIKAAQEADLIEAGRYRFQVESYESKKDDKEYFDEEQTQRNPWFNKTRHNLRLSLSSKRDGAGKDAPFTLLERPRTFFQRVASATVLNSKGELSNESKFFGQMAGIAAKGTGQNMTVKEVLDYFTEHAAEITITKSEATEKYPDAKNWVRAIKALNETV